MRREELHGDTLTSWVHAENPRSSRLWELPPIRGLFKVKQVQHVVFDMCQYGQLYKKRTAVMTNMPELHQLERLCTRDHQHQPLRGTVKVVDGGRARYQNRTAVAGTYPPQLGKQCSAPPSAMGETTWRKKRKRPVAMTEQIKALPLATIKSMGTSRRTSAAIPSKKRRYLI